VVSAWSGTKDWAAVVAAPPAPEVAPDSVPSPELELVLAVPAAELAKATDAPMDEADDSVSVPSSRNSRGRGGNRDRGARNREGDVNGDAVIANGDPASRIRSKGRGRRDMRSGADAVSTDETAHPPFSHDISSSEPALDLPLLPSDATELLMHDLPATAELPSLPTTAAETGSAMQASDPAIMMVGSGKPPEASCFAASDGGGLIPSLLGGAGAGFAGFEGAPAAPPPAAQFISGFDERVPPSNLEAMCQPGPASVCTLSSPPVSLPLPASLVTALPGAVGCASPLPGFCVGANAVTDASPRDGLEPLQGGLVQLSIGGDLLPSSAPADPLPASMLPAGMLAAGATIGAPPANLAPIDGLSGVAPNPLAPMPTPPMKEALRSQGHGRSAPATSALPPMQGPTPTPGIQPAARLGLDAMSCAAPGPCTPNDARVGSLVAQPMQSLMPSAADAHAC